MNNQTLVDLQKELEKDLRNKVVFNKLTNPHALIIKCREEMTKRNWEKRGLIISGRENLDLKVAKSNISRALRFLDALIKWLELRGHSISVGEDTYVIIKNERLKIALRELRGFQQNGIGARLKHFTGHGESLGGINQAPSDYPERVLRGFHLEPFRLPIERAHPYRLMPAYIEIDGIHCSANSWLINDVLREESNFKGVVVSDWWAIDQLYEKHLVGKIRKMRLCKRLKPP
jgi:Glycosyl hydrolase family 3 N terminal domain